MLTGTGGLNQLLKSQLVGYREAFNLFDRDGDGKVTAEDFVVTFKLLGMEVKDDQVISMVEAADDDGSGELEFAEFVLVLSNARNQTDGAIRLDTISELREMWAYFDQDGSGSITEDEITEVLITLGANPETAPATAHDMMMTADAGGDGEIEFIEFVEIMSKARGEEKDDEKLFDSTKQLDTPQAVLESVLGPPIHIPKISSVAAVANKASEQKNASTKWGKAKQETHAAAVAAAKASGPMAKRTREIEMMRHEVIRAHLDDETKVAKRMEAQLAAIEKEHHESAEVIYKVLRDRYNLEFFNKLPEAIAIELCCHCQLNKYEPNTQLIFEGKPADAWFLILEGGGVVRKTIPTDRHGNPLELSAVAVWLDIREATTAMLYALHEAQELMPSKDKIGISKKTRLMLLKCEEAELGTTTWFNTAKTHMSNDMDDIHQQLWLVKSGRYHVVCLRELYGLVDDVRKEFLLLKACTQLSSARDKRARIQEAEHMVNTLKDLAAATLRALSVLESVFVPENVVENDGLKQQLAAQDDPVLGKCLLELKQKQCFGDLIFQIAAKGEDLSSPVSVSTNHEAETICLSVSRKAYLYAVVVEEVQFLHSVPAFQLVELSQLQKLCMHVKKRVLSFSQIFARAGHPANDVFVVQSGEIDVRIFVENRDDEVDRELAEMAGEKNEEKNGTMHSVAFIGERDMINEFELNERGEKVYMYDAVCVKNGSVVFQIDREALSKVTVGPRMKPFELKPDPEKVAYRKERVQNLQDANETALQLLDASTQLAKDAENQVYELCAWLHTLIDWLMFKVSSVLANFKRDGGVALERDNPLPPVVPNSINSLLERQGFKVQTDNSFSR